MTVAELIERLQSFPQDSEIVFSSYFDGVHEPTQVEDVSINSYGEVEIS